MDVITAVDAGTSSIRAVLFDLSGAILAIHSYSYSPRFLSDGRVRQSPDTWQQGLISVCSEAAVTCRENGYTPLCVSLTGQRASVLPIGADNRPIGEAIMWQDKATSEECDEIGRRLSAREVFETTGLRIDSYFSAPKILWLRNHTPGVFKAASKFVGVQDYITYLVTGEFCTDFSQASRTLLFDLHALEWSEHILGELSIPVAALPHALPAGSCAGVTANVFEARTGFRSGVPVILAGGDQQVAAVGMGVFEPGIAEANTGTGSFLITPVDTPALDPEMRALCSVSAVAGRWV
ncbi:MAG: xylulokinase, partial [bacterium]